MKEGERSRQADTERERQSNLQMHLLDAPNEICLSWRGACSRKNEQGPVCVQLAFSPVSSLSLLLCQPISPRMHVCVPQPGSGEMLQTVFDTFVFGESDLLPEFSAQHLISGEMISRVD